MTYFFPLYSPIDMRKDFDDLGLIIITLGQYPLHGAKYIFD